MWGHFILSKVTKVKRKRVKKELLEKKERTSSKKEAEAIQTNLVAVDDATGAITGAWFDIQETLNGYYPQISIKVYIAMTHAY